MKPPMWILIDDYIDHMISFFEILFEKGIESGHFRPHNPKSKAVAVFAGLDSIAAYMIIGKELILKEIVDHFDQDFILDIKVNST